MSIPAFAWAIEMGRAHNLCPDDRCLLMVLANMADKQGECFPLQATLTADTGMPKRTLIRSTQRLEAAGLIRTEARGRSQTYHIERANGATVAPNGSGKSATQAPVRGGNGATEAPDKGATQAPVKQRLVPNEHATGAKSARNGATVAPRTFINQEREPKNPPPIVPPPPGRDRVSYPADFDAFWLAYPRKAGKRAALKGWAGAVTRAGGASAIMAGLASHRFAHEERYIPHPSTWLNRDQWLDEHDSFDPVLRAVGLTPEDFADWPVPDGRLLQ